MHFSLRQKIIAVNLTLLLIVTVAASLISTYELEQYYEARIFEQLKTQIDEAEYFFSKLDFPFPFSTEDYQTLTEFAGAAKLRLTLIDSSGIVIFDSRVHIDSLQYVENHIDRPEIQMALRRGIGRNERVSTTIGAHLFYTAKSISFFSKNKTDILKQARFIRVAIPFEEVEFVLRDVRLKIFAAGGFALLLIAAVSLLLSKKITDPIRYLARVAEKVKQGNLDAHFEHNSSGDIGELADLLNEMVAKLRDDVKQMQKLQTMRSQFLGNVSHELRTPIFALQGYLETFLQESRADKSKKRMFVEKAFQSSVRLNNLLTDLIDISRIESGEMKMSFRNILVHEWLAKTVTDYSAKDSKKGVTIHFANKGRESSCKVMGDKERLSQVLLNLIQNAINYNKEGGKVTIGYSEYAKEVRIFVSDTGYGINDEHISRIFERFYRVDKERSRYVGGTGLGLAIVKHIIEAHKSKVTVESEIGVGSTFSFALQKK